MITIKEVEYTLVQLLEQGIETMGSAEGAAEKTIALNETVDLFIENSVTEHAKLIIGRILVDKVFARKVEVNLSASTNHRWVAVAETGELPEHLVYPTVKALGKLTGADITDYIGHKCRDAESIIPTVAELSGLSEQEVKELMTDRAYCKQFHEQDGSVVRVITTGGPLVKATIKEDSGNGINILSDIVPSVGTTYVSNPVSRDISNSIIIMDMDNYCGELATHLLGIWAANNQEKMTRLSINLETINSFNNIMSELGETLFGDRWTSDSIDRSSIPPSLVHHFFETLSLKCKDILKEKQLDWLLRQGNQWTGRLETLRSITDFDDDEVNDLENYLFEESGLYSMVFGFTDRSSDLIDENVPCPVNVTLEPYCENSKANLLNALKIATGNRPINAVHRKQPKVSDPSLMNRMGGDYDGDVGIPHDPNRIIVEAYLSAYSSSLKQYVKDNWNKKNEDSTKQVWSHVSSLYSKFKHHEFEGLTVATRSDIVKHLKYLRKHGGRVRPPIDTGNVDWNELRVWLSDNYDRYVN